MSRKFVGLRPHSSREEIANYVNRAFETSNLVEICKAIGAVTHLHNISDIAKISRVERGSVYRAFAGGQKHPNFKTVLSVLDAMGFQLQVKVRQGGHASPSRLARSSELSKT